MTLTILADDLTGGCDTGALFTRAGPVPVTVFPQRRAPGDAAVIDSESRSLTAAAARSQVQALAVLGASSDVWFKKIDSTLRGHVAVEIQALLDAAGIRGALVCPAFPAEGRTVVGRTLMVNGRPVSETPVVRDPDFPSPSSDIVSTLQATANRPVDWCPLADVRAGRIPEPTDSIVVCDAERDTDLDAIVAAAQSIGSRPVLVGSAGLGASLARALGMQSDPPRLPAGARWLIVAGSRHPATAAQVEAVARPSIRILRAPSELEPDRHAVAAELARKARKLIESERVDLVAVTGGDTAVALYRELDADRLDLLGAPLPGLALGRLRWANDRAVTVLTKAGGFGTPDLFVRLLS